MPGFSKAFGVTTGVLVALAVVIIGSGMVCMTCIVANWPQAAAAANANDNTAQQVETVQPRLRQRKSGLP